MNLFHILVENNANIGETYIRLYQLAFVMAQIQTLLNQNQI